MKNENKKCSSKNHEKIKAISLCYECKIYMCNNCEKIHSELFFNHHAYNLKNNLKDIFTGFCNEANHNYDLEFFCETHNKLICSSCITAIQDDSHGQHTNCEICLINDIKDEKKNDLNENIKILEELSNIIEESIKKLKILSEKIFKNKEDLKASIQNIFTKLRNLLNNREDELLMEVEEKYKKIFFSEDFIKNNEKLPDKIKKSLEKVKSIDENDWIDKNKIKFLINDTINVENNIENINLIKNKINNYNNNSLIEEIKFYSEEEENFIEKIKSFGKIVYIYNILEDSIIINGNQKYKGALIDWLNFNNFFRAKLLYRKSTHGDSYSTFHNLCDNKGSTLIFIKSKEGFIIGGYTPSSWESKGGWKEDNKSFLFSLTDNKVFRNLGKVKSIFCGNKCGPLFNYIGFSENTKNMSMAEFQLRDYFKDYAEIIPNEGVKKFFGVEEVEVYQIIKGE